jgi:DHA1 family tetracycline resistance protein-like MFS transporter
MPPQWRAASFGMLLAGMFLGFATAPTLALTMSHLHISMLACGMVAFGFVNALLFFPETLSPEKAAMAQETRRGQVAGMTKRERIIWNLKRPAWELSILNRSDFFRLLSLLAFFSGMVSSGDQTLLIYYVEERLGFNDKDVATMFLLVGVLGIFSQAVLLKPFIECAGERMVVTFCFIVGAVDNFLYGIADEKTLIFVGMACGSLTNMAFPTISAIKANNVDESEQGRIQGALFSVQALASGTGPIAMRYVYHLTVDGAFLGPGSMFVFASGLSLVAAGCAYALPKDRADSRPSTRASLRDLYYEDTEVEASESALFAADATTPMLDAEAASESSGSYGTDGTQTGTEIL